MRQSEMHPNSASGAPWNEAVKAAAEPGVNLRILTVAAALSAICALNSSILGWGVLQSWAFTLASLALFLLRVLLGRQTEQSEHSRSLLSQGAMILPALSVLLVLSVSRELTGLHFFLATLALLCSFLRSRDIVHIAFGVLLLYFFVAFADELTSLLECSGAGSLSGCIFALRIRSGVAENSLSIGGSGTSFRGRRAIARLFPHPF